MVWRSGGTPKDENKKHVVWAVGWEEHERGWGTRPDGYFLYLNKDKARDDTTVRAKKVREQEEDWAKQDPYGELDSVSIPCHPPGRYNEIEITPLEVGEETYKKIVANGGLLKSAPGDAVPPDGVLP